MMVSLSTLAMLALAGAIAGLDIVSFPQAMLSRPVVAATVGGALCGNAAGGLMVGVLLECFALETMPFGASRYPEWGPASVAAGALVALPASGADVSQRVMPFALLAGLAAAFVGGATLVWLRHFNLRVAERHRDAIAHGDAIAVGEVHGIGLLVDFARAAALTAAFVLMLLPARRAVLFALHTDVDRLSVAAAGTVAVGVAGGAVWKVVHTTKGYQWWLLGGLGVGAALAAFR